MYVSTILTDPAAEHSSFVCGYADEFRGFDGFQSWLKQSGWQSCDDEKGESRVSVRAKDLGDGRALVSGLSVSIRYLHSELETWGSTVEPQSSSSVTIWVENEDANQPSCGCKTPSQHWEKFKKSKASRCAGVGCIRTDVDGACVKRIPDQECYAVPLCSLHRRSGGHFPVSLGLMVLALKQKSCSENFES